MHSAGAHADSIDVEVPLDGWNGVVEDPSVIVHSDDEPPVLSLPVDISDNESMSLAIKVSSALGQH